MGAAVSKAVVLESGGQGSRYLPYSRQSGPLSPCTTIGQALADLFDLELRAALAGDDPPTDRCVLRIGDANQILTMTESDLSAIEKFWAVRKGHRRPDGSIAP